MNITEFCQRIPKADIHYHLLGGVRFSTMLDFAKKYHVPLTSEEAQSYYRAYYQEGKPAKGGIAALTFLYQIMKAPEDYARVLYEVAEDAHDSGVRYIETFWNPSDTHLSYQSVTNTLASMIDKVAIKFNIKIRLIPSINREKSPEIAYEMVEMMAKYPHPYVLGIGIDYREDNAPVEHFWKAYQYAKQLGYKLTAHCSEFGLHWRNIESGIELLNIDRIDHGYTIIDNAELCQKYTERNIPFTVIPSNTYYYKKWKNKQIWRENHPIREMGKRGLNIIPCTDDWHIHNTTTAKCYQSMVEDFGFDIKSLKSFIKNSIRACWLNEKEKAMMEKQWIKEFDMLYQQLEQSPIQHTSLIQYRR